MKNVLKIAALVAAMAAPVAADDLTAMSDAERDAFRAEVRAYLMENPEVLLEAMQVLRDREAVAEAAADDALLARYASEIFDDGISWVGGNPDGDLTIVEFLDYRCGYCRRAHPEFAAMLADDGNIRWIVKELPILGPDSEASARMAIATLRELGDAAYDRVHEVLMTFEGPVNEKTMPLIAKRADIDLSQIVDKLASAEVDEHIARVRALADVMKVNGTPSFIIGGTVLRGYLPRANLEAIVADERDRAG